MGMMLLNLYNMFLVLVYQITRSQKLYLHKHPFTWLIPCDLSEAHDGGLYATLG